MTFYVGKLSILIFGYLVSKYRYSTPLKLCLPCSAYETSARKKSAGQIEKEDVLIPLLVFLCATSAAACQSELSATLSISDPCSCSSSSFFCVSECREGGRGSLVLMEEEKEREEESCCAHESQLKIFESLSSSRPKCRGETERERERERESVPKNKSVSPSSPL